MKYILLGLYPFMGTIIGSLFVFFLKNKLNQKVEKIMLGLASGVMLSASFFSLLLPAIELSEPLKLFKFFPSCFGFGVGIVIFVVVDKLIFKIRKSDYMMPLVVTLHNIPEGMAVGVAITSLLLNDSLISYTSVLALSIGIALQNIPEGAIISLTLKSQGKSKFRSFIIGALSGIVEPLATLSTIIFTNIITFILPYSLALASGAMVYVIIEELLPKAYEENSKVLTISFTIGFIIMMFLDVMLG